MSRLDFFATLTRGTKQALPFLQSAASSDLSANEILKSARASGLSFRTQQALDVIGILRDNVNAARSIRTTPADQPLDPDRFGTSIGPTLRNYSYKVQRTVVNSETGETSVGYVTVSSNDALSQDQILSTAETYTGPQYGAEADLTEVTDMRVIDATKSPAL